MGQLGVRSGTLSCLWGVVLTLLLLSACSYDRQPPGRAFPVTCPSGQTRLCNGQCAPVMVRNQLCRLDECSPSVRAPGISSANIGVCDPTLRCDPTLVDSANPGYSGVGRCAPATEARRGCDPSSALGSPSNPCPTLTYCRAVGAALPGGGFSGGACAARPSTVASNAVGACAAPLEEGAEGCDGDWSSVIRPSARVRICNPCGPGLTCNAGVCRRSCGPQTGIPDAGIDASAFAISTVGIGACVPDPTNGSFIYACAASSADAAVRAECLRLSAHRQRCPPAPSFETGQTDTRTSLGPILPVANVLRSLGPVTSLTSTFVDGSSVCNDPLDVCFGTLALPQGFPQTCCRPMNSPCTSVLDCCQVPARAGYEIAPRRINGGNPNATVICAQVKDAARSTRCIDYAPCGIGELCGPLSECANVSLGLPPERACVPCGRAVGDPCCPNPPSIGSPRCVRGTVCGGNTCVPCGQPGPAPRVPGQPCCDNRQCNPGGLCDPADNRCYQCGQDGLTCCANSTCFAGTQCGPDNVCHRCGANREQCCNPGGRCDAGNVCVTGQGFGPTPTCVECGDVGQRCCAGSTCNLGRVCNTTTNRCLNCGGRDMPCCSGNVCGSGLVCESGVCRDACGALDQRCCGGSSCNSGLTCGPAGTCRPCGAEVGMSCCPGSTCVAGFTCSPTSNTCQRCGAPGQPCCSNSSARCAAGAGCDTSANVCRTCGVFGLPCCPSDVGPPCFDNRLTCNPASNSCGG